MKTQCLLLLLSIPFYLYAETAEIKMLIDETKRVEALSLLGVKAAGEPETRVCFFDTKEALLNQHQLILRVRLDTKADEEGKKDADTIVKKRGTDQPPKDYGTMKPEIDWIGPSTSKPSYAIKEKSLAEATVMSVLNGKLTLKNLLTAGQVNFANACLKQSGGGEVPWSSLIRYGVISAWKSKRKVGDFSKVTVETWKLSREGKAPLELLEISIKVEGATDSEITAQAAAFYKAAEEKGLGVPTGASKTSRVIEYYKP